MFIRMTVLAAGLLLIAQPAIAQPDAAPPRTGFELSNGARWTTLDEEAAFLRQVDQASRRVAVDQIGTSVQGRPLNLVRVGDPAPRSTSAAAGTVVLFSCMQHGDEPAAREPCLSTVRDLAFTTDPALVSLLRRVTLLFIPTVNPDGRVADDRENANGVDINRDHVGLVSPEARALAAVLRDYRPDVVHDLHEFGGTRPYYFRDVLWLWPRNLNVGKGVYDESVRLSKDYVRPAVGAAGYTSGVYGIWADPVTDEPIRQVAGDGQERILRNTVGLKHSVGLLLESLVNRRDAAEQADPALNARRRVDSHLAALRGTLRLVAERQLAIEIANLRSRLAALANRGPVYFGGADNQPPDPADVDTTPPCGYRLTADQYQQVADELALHGVFSRPAAGGARFVPLRQLSRPMVPLLLDGRADYRLLAAEPVSCP